MSSKYLSMAGVMVAYFSVCFGLRLSQPLATMPRKPTLSKISFYKFSLQWPPFTCNSGKFICKPTIPLELTINGLWPQDINDVEVSDYNQNNPCTNVPPTPARTLQFVLKPILKDLLESLWPNLKDPQNTNQNFAFWEHEWETHGTCSDYSTQPLVYFNSAVQLRKGLDPVMGLTVGSSDTLQAFAAKVKSVVGAYPEIACNRNKVNKALQLWEIRLCYQNPTLPKTVQNCPKKFSGDCKSLTDVINFPS